MKKIIALLLVLVMSLGLFAGCVEEKVEDTGLAAAKEYLYAMYKEEEGTKTTVNFDRVAVVRIDGVSYEIDWTIKVVSGDEGIVTIQKNEAEKTVTFKVSEEVPNETKYVLTATIKGQNGATETLEFNHVVPKVPTAAEILDMAYALESGATLDGTYKLTGVISTIDSAWSDDYKNITVTIVCNGDTARPMMCYRLVSGANTDASKLAVGDTITVMGKIKNYSGTVEFDAKCELLNVVPGAGGEEKPAEGYDPTGKTPAEIVDAAYALEPGAAFAKPATLTGKVISVDTAYSADYKNVTVTIVVEGKEDKPIECFRMKGEGADVVKEGDTITVTGTIKNYVNSEGKSKIEFDAGCTLDKLNAGEGGDTTTPGGDTTAPDLTTTAGILSAAFALKDGETLPQEVTLTGVVTKLGDINAQYGDRNVNFTVEGKDIYCYALKGDVSKLVVGDTITVKGTMKNYKGTVEFDKAQLVSGGSGSGETPAPTPDPEPTPGTTVDTPNANTGALSVVANGTQWFVTQYDGKNNAAVEAATDAAAAGTVTVYLSSDGAYAKIKVGDTFIAPKGGNANGITAGEYVWAVVKNADGTYKFMGQGDDTVTLALNVYQDYNKIRAYKNSNLEEHPESYFFNFALTAN